MSSSLRMAVRETRASWRRLLFFFVCIAVGVAVDRRAAFGDPERPQRLRQRGESLIAADIVISTNRDCVRTPVQLIDRRLSRERRDEHRHGSR